MKNLIYIKLALLILVCSSEVLAISIIADDLSLSDSEAKELGISVNYSPKSKSCRFGPSLTFVAPASLSKQQFFSAMIVYPNQNVDIVYMHESEGRVKGSICPSLKGSLEFLLEYSLGPTKAVFTVIRMAINE